MGTGFNKDLAAADNIILNGLMLGMKKKRMKKLVQPILEFAELEKQRNKPVKYFSKGMKSRLAFSIAVAVHPGLLIIDEALSAGDLSFKQKATEAMDEMIAKAEAVIVVSHNLNFVQSVCTRAVWIDRGRLEYDGDPEEAVKRYRQSLKK
jgi:teichoic acid transport system ATP-binding protein